MIVMIVSNDIRSVHLDNNCDVAPLGVADIDTVILGTAELVILVLTVALVEVIIIAPVDVILVVDPDNCIGVPINVFSSITIRTHDQ